jgi:hypothetical protein
MDIKLVLKEVLNNPYNDGVRGPFLDYCEEQGITKYNWLHLYRDSFAYNTHSKCFLIFENSWFQWRGKSPKIRWVEATDSYSVCGQILYTCGVFKTGVEIPNQIWLQMTGQLKITKNQYIFTRIP